MVVTYKLANIEISTAFMPSIDISRSTGDEGYKVSVRCDGAFTDDQIAASLLGSTTSISVDNLTFTGVVTGFGVREGYSICEISEATCSI